MTRRRKVVLFTVGAVSALVLVAWGWAAARPAPLASLETAAVDRGPVVAKVIATGTLSEIVTVLVSVTERTRESIRMAVGAKPRDIRLQFLGEALALSLVGGLLGVALGAAAAARIAASLGWQVLYRPDIVLIAVAFSSLVGVGFGLYPAHKAAKLDPIQALRFE